MTFELIAVAQTPDDIREATYWSSRRPCHLTLIYIGSDLFTLPSPLDLHFLTSAPGQWLPHINHRLLDLQASWVFLVSGTTLYTLDNLEYLLQVAPTIPRLASLSSVSFPGLSQVRSNSLFGTLYSQSLFPALGTWDEQSDLSVATRDWADRVSQQGWIHMTTCCNSRPVDSGKSVEPVSSSGISPP